MLFVWSENVAGVKMSQGHDLTKKTPYLYKTLFFLLKSTDYGGGGEVIKMNLRKNQ